MGWSHAGIVAASIVLSANGEGTECDTQKLESYTPSHLPEANPGESCCAYLFRVTKATTCTSFVQDFVENYDAVWLMCKTSSDCPVDEACDDEVCKGVDNDVYFAIAIGSVLFTVMLVLLFRVAL